MRSKLETLVQQAREAHRKAGEHSGLSGRYREQRDDAIRRAYGLGTYSYGSLARQIGCSAELIAKIVNGRSDRQPKCPNCGRRRHDKTVAKCYLC